MARIEYKDGDILKCEERILIHQTNCLGIMGSGVAKQIRAKSPRTYLEYREFCDRMTPEELLGKVQLVVDDDKVYVNLFSQLDFGRKKRHTDYEAMDDGLRVLKVYLDTLYKDIDRIAIPYNIGCGLGGGDWSIVVGIIEGVFSNWDGTIVFYKYEG